MGLRFTRTAAAAAIAALVLGWAAPVFAASPSGGTVGPSHRSSSWDGKVFIAGSTPGPGVCPPPDKVLCDHYALKVDVSQGYWNDHTGSVKVAISWSSSSNNFDLYVYRAGRQVAASASRSGRSEAVSQIGRAHV